MLPALVWLGLGVGAAALLGIRAQVALAGWYPGAAWSAAVLGLLAGGGILAVFAVIVFTFRSWRLTGLLLVALPVLVVAGGVMAIRRPPADRFVGADTAAQWDQLHPALRLAVRVAAAEDWGLRIADIVRAPAAEAPILPEGPPEVELSPEAEALPPTDAEFAVGPEVEAALDVGPAVRDPEPDASPSAVVHGYSRAVDLYGTPAGPLRAWAREGLFLAMGLQAVRHEGSPDEVHLSLPR
ncbi:MAG: hypothetical protein AB1505_17610 [Candidatus Latescibacterota bacterium]